MNGCSNQKNMNVDQRVLTVRFTSTKNCFVSLPKNWNLHESPVTLEVQDVSGDVTCHVTWAGHKSSEDVLMINGLFGHRLRLVDGTEVLVKVFSAYVSPCVSAVVHPLSSDDWELMNMNSSTVETGLIHQIRCIWSRIIFPIWVSGNICLFVEVESVYPDVCPVLLQANTEVIIVPHQNVDLNRSNSGNSTSQRGDRSPRMSSPRQEKTRKEVARTSSFNQVLNAFMNVFTPATAQQQPLDENPQKYHSHPRNDILKGITVALHFRVLSLLDLLTEKVSDSDLLSPTTVFVNENSFGEAGSELPDSFLCYLNKLLSPAEKIDVIKAQEDKTKTPSYKTAIEVVRVIVVRDNSSHPFPWGFKYLQPGAVAIHDLLRRQLGLEKTARVWIQSINHCEEGGPANVVLHPLSLSFSQSEEKLPESFRQWISKLRLPLATSGEGTLVHFPKDGGTDLVLKVEPESKAKAYWILQDDEVNVKRGVKVAPQLTLWGPHLPCKLEAVEQKFMPVGPKLDDLGGAKEIAQSVLEWLELNLRLSPLSQRVSVGSGAGVPCLLLCGVKGVGKTALCQAICQRVHSWRGRVVHTLILPCRNLRGKRVESLRKVWQLELSESLHRQPSLLVLDDLDLIASAPSGPEGEAGLDALYFSRIAQTLISLQDMVQESQVVLIATSKSVQALHPKLTSSRGRHFFSKVVHIQTPDVDQREEILRSLLVTKTHLSDECLQNVSIPRLAAKTDGYVAHDLDMLVDRATHAAFLNEANVGFICSHRVLCDDSFDVALQDFVPSSLCGLSLHTDPTKSWEDLGGLEPVKEALLQTLIWPLKYPKLFGQSPLRVQSGVLLYGAPGTGKTLLAGILAAEAGLNFISIKGPELLSKFIGASEQAVRDLFQRAQSAKPCILFFDEFDAIVPRRGHDSTGVTDRVVNQFLTQMDGVESLSGVYVLAASSRPDLIDPALLRPGRIDKCLHCPLPQEAERKDILSCLSRRLNMDPEVDQDVLAEQTNHFSGADLQALLYSAQLEALHDFQRTKGFSRKDSELASLCMEDIIFLPSLGQGPQDLEVEKNRDDIIQEMERVVKNSMQTSKPNQRESRFNRFRRKSSALGPCINQGHLIKALEQAKESVLSRDRSKFDMIYEEFQRCRDGESRPLLSQFQRATLA